LAFLCRFLIETIKVRTRAKAAIEPITLPAMAPADKAGFIEGVDGGFVVTAVADDISGAVVVIELEVVVAMTDDGVVDTA
jgi:hypothetical protein